MPKTCCVPTCRLQGDVFQEKKTTFHTFPADTNLREKWEQELRSKFVNLSLPKCCYICSSHFKADCFYFAGKLKNVRLKQGSYPSIFASSEQDELEKQFVEADTGCNNEKSQLVEPEVNKQVDICKNESSNNQSENSQAESDGQSNANTSICAAAFPAAELAMETNVSRSKNLTEKVPSKSRTKSLLNIDVESLDASQEIKNILKQAQGQIIGLQRRNKTLQMKLYRWKKGVKTANSLMSHLKHHKLPFSKSTVSLSRNHHIKKER